MHFCSMVAKSWECKSDNNKSIGQRLAKILVYCEKPWRTSIGLKQLVKVSHRGLVGGRLELGEALYVDRLVVPCTVKQSACPHFLSLSKSFDQYWSFSIIIKRFFIHTDLRWHHLWTTRSLGLIQSHGRCEEPHTELRWWQSLFSFSYEIFIMIFMTIFPLRDHPPHVFLGEERICFIWGMYSFPAAVSWFADCPDWNHIWPGFTPLIILRMMMIMMIQW